MSPDQNSTKTTYRKWSPEDKQRYYDAWKKSSLTLSKFCRENHISISLFSKWVKKFENRKTPPLTFVPVETQNVSSPEELGMELKFANGLQCRFTRVANVALILEIIRGIHHVTAHSK